MEIKLCLTHPDTLEEYSIKALLDSGTTSSIISQKFVIDNDIPAIPLETLLQCIMLMVLKIQQDLFVHCSITNDYR